MVGGQKAQAGHQPEPQGAGVNLNPLVGVPVWAVTGEKLFDRSKVYIGVIANPGVFKKNENQEEKGA